MTSDNFLTTAGGVGIFLFSLRYLNTTLQRSIARRVRPVINSMLSSGGRCMLMGLALTALVQASSITIVASMGLLSGGLISLEQGWYLMLGATIGTTLKAWLFAGGFQYAPWLIGASALLRLSGRQPARREVADVLLAMGLCFLGLNMLASGLTPILEQPWVQEVLAGMGAQSGLAGEIVPVVVGCFLAVAVQSSSAMVILTISLAGHGMLSLTTGAALILGMNIGTTSTELLASAESGREGRALAYGHCIIKVAGVLAVLLLFPFYVGALDAGVSLVAPQASLGLRLAVLHTVFNLGNAVVWSLLSGPAVAYLQRMGGGRATHLGLALAVRKILQAAPDLAGLELDRQLTTLLHLMKLVQDRWITRLVAGGAAPNDKGDSFGAVEETMGDLLFGLARRGGEAQRPSLVRALDILGCCQQIYATWQLVGEHVDRSDEGNNPVMPAVLRTQVEETAARWDRIWLGLLFPDRMEGKAEADHGDLLRQLLAYCREQHGLTADSARWLIETVGLLSSVDASMHRLGSLSRQSTAAPRTMSVEVEMEPEPVPQAVEEEVVA